MPCFFFQWILKICTKVGSYRQPFHRRGANRNFFQLSLLILRLKFWQNVPYGDDGRQRVNIIIIISFASKLETQLTKVIEVGNPPVS